jgi:hypothetical protein
MSVTITLAPLMERATAVALPIPSPAPVTRAILFLNSDTNKLNYFINLILQ